MSVRIYVEAGRGHTRFAPDFFGLDRLGGVEGVVAADMAHVSVWVAGDHMPCRMLRFLAAADEPLAGPHALSTVPVAVLQLQVVALVQEGEKRGKWTT